jgi:hypothetical protein
MKRTMRRLSSGLIFRLVLFIASFVLSATGCFGSNCASAPVDGVLIANPDRPTVSNPADITQYGVLEVESGYARTWLRGGERDNDFAGLLKFSVLCDLELHWGPDAYVNVEAGPRSPSGIGDNLVGAQFRFLHQTQHLPTLAFRYDAKLPTASVGNGLGSGEVDHFFTLLASKDLGNYHFDFNLGYFLAGRPVGHAFDSNFLFALAASRSIKGPLGIALEGSGTTTLNQENDAFASILTALTYKVSSRLIIDSGISFGVSSAAPHKTFFAGFTYSIADIYGYFRKR